VLKIVENLWGSGLCSEPRWGSSQCSPDPLAGEEGACFPLPKNLTPALGLWLRFSAPRAHSASSRNSLHH